MRFAVESWSPEYGSPTESMGLTGSSGPVDPWVESDVGDWAPRVPDPAAEPFASVAFVDGVRRVEANVFITGTDGPLRLGLHRPGFIGYVKTHHAAYGPPLVRDIVTRLGCGERTPLLLLGGPVPRFS